MMQKKAFSELLESLDRVGASPEFTRRVLERVDDDPHNPVFPSGSRRGWLAAALLFAVAGLASNLEIDRKTELERRANLKAEQMEIEADLQRLREATSGFDRVIDLGSGENGVRYVLELDPQSDAPQFASMDMTY